MYIYVNQLGVDCHTCCKMVAHKLLHQNQYIHICQRMTLCLKAMFWVTVVLENRCWKLYLPNIIICRKQDQAVA